MLARGSRRLAKRLGQPTMSAARGNGFFGNFKESLKKEMAKNKELQETLKSLREDETLAKAREAAKKAAAGVQKAAQTAGSSASTAAEQASARASTAASQAAQMAEEARAKAGFGASGSGADGGSKSSADAEQAAGAKPADGRSFFDQVRDRLGGLFGAGSAAPARGQGDPNSTEVIVKEPSFWEKTFNFASESPFGRFGAVFGDAAGGVGDRIFGETEQAEALRELREIMPDFDMDTFLATEVVQKQKDVLGAYLRGDMEALRRTCRDAAYGALHKSVMERQAHQLKMDERLLYLSDPEIESVRFIGGIPTPVISFEAHQLNCVRSKTTGKIVEGNEDDIRAVHYLFAMQPNEELVEAQDEWSRRDGAQPAEKDEAEGKGAAGQAEGGEGSEKGRGAAREAPPEGKWQVTELAVRGMMSVY